MPAASDPPTPKRIGDVLAAGAPPVGLGDGLPTWGCIDTRPGDVEVIREGVACRSAGRPRPAETGEDDVEDDEDLDARDQSGVTPDDDEGRVIANFAVGPPGVGPVMGVGSDDFFPSAPDPDPVPDNLRAGGDDAESP